MSLALPLFAEHLGRCSAAVPGADNPLSALGMLATEDLYLACAAGADLPHARELFARQFLQPLTAAVRSIDPAPALVDEVRQTLHESLLLGQVSRADHEGGPGPRILQYGGRAPLATWVAVAAQRAALGLLRADGARRRVIDRAALEPLRFADDPELQYLKERYRGAFKDAVGRAISGLDQRQRTVIRLHTVSGLTLARIGVMLGVDESTVSRWVQRAREQILSETHRQLGATLGVRLNELPSLVRLVQSQLDVSVARLLNEEDTDVTKSR